MSVVNQGLIHLSAYTPAEAERGKFVSIMPAWLSAMDYPSFCAGISARGRYAVLTYQVNEVPISLSAGQLYVNVSTVNIDEPVTIDWILHTVGVSGTISSYICGQPIQVCVPTSCQPVSTWVSNWPAQPISAWITNPSLETEIISSVVINTVVVSAINEISVSLSSAITAILIDPVTAVEATIVGQPISAWIVNPVLNVSGVNISITEPVTIDYIESTVAVSGDVGVINTVAVSGTVTVANLDQVSAVFILGQPISAALTNQCCITAVEVTNLAQVSSIFVNNSAIDVNIISGDIEFVISGVEILNPVSAYQLGNWIVDVANTVAVSGLVSAVVTNAEHVSAYITNLAQVSSVFVTNIEYVSAYVTNLNQVSAVLVTNLDQVSSVIVTNLDQISSIAVTNLAQVSSVFVNNSAIDVNIISGDIEFVISGVEVLNTVAVSGDIGVINTVAISGSVAVTNLDQVSAVAVTNLDQISAVYILGQPISAAITNLCCITAVEVTNLNQISSVSINNLEQISSIFINNSAIDVNIISGDIEFVISGVEVLNPVSAYQLGNWVVDVANTVAVTGDVSVNNLAQVSAIYILGQPISAALTNQCCVTAVQVTNLAQVSAVEILNQPISTWIANPFIYVSSLDIEIIKPVPVETVTVVTISGDVGVINTVAVSGTVSVDNLNQISAVYILGQPISAALTNQCCITAVEVTNIEYASAYVTNLGQVSSIYVNNLAQVSSVYVNNLAQVSSLSAFVTNLEYVSAYVTNLAQISDIYVTNLAQVSNVYVNNIEYVSAYVTNLAQVSSVFVTNLEYTSAYITNLAQVSSIFVTNLEYTSAYITNLAQVSNVYINNLAQVSSLSAFVTNIEFVSAYVTNLAQVSSIFVTNLEYTSAYITNLAQVSNVFVNNLEYVSAYVTNLEQVSNVYVNNLAQVSSVYILGQPISTVADIPNTTYYIASTLTTGTLYNITFPFAASLIEVVNYGQATGANPVLLYVMLQSSAALGDPTAYGLPLAGTRLSPGYYSNEYTTTGLFIETDTTGTRVRVAAHRKA